MPDSEQITVYQLKIFILGISPMIWRRIKRSDNTIAAKKVVSIPVRVWGRFRCNPELLDYIEALQFQSL